MANQLCIFFGGAYDAATHTYRTPQLTVPGVAMGAVRRAFPKRMDNADFYLGAVGAPTGCQIVILLSPGEDFRVGFGGALYGLKKIRHDVTMDVLVHSEASYAEDVQDALYSIRDAIMNKIHADRTCGSGGIEGGGFQVGESAPWIRWTDGGVVSRAEKTEALLRCTFATSEYIIA